MNKHIRFAVMNTLTHEFVTTHQSLGCWTESVYDACLFTSNVEAELARTDALLANDQYSPSIIEVVRINPDIRRVTRGRPSKK